MEEHPEVTFFPKTDFRSTLTEEELRELREIEVRSSVYSELYGRDEWGKLKGRVISFFLDVKDLFLSGKVVDRPHIVGKTGEELQVFIAGRDMREFLPQGANFGFLGVAVTPEDPKAIVPQATESSSPRFNVSNQKVELVTEIKRGAFGRRTDRTVNSSLSILHEIGHARDEVKNHRFITILKQRQLALLFPNNYRDFGMNIEGAVSAVANRQTILLEAFSRELKDRVERRVENRFRASGRYSTDSLLRLWGEEVEGVKKEFAEKIFNDPWKIYQEAFAIARSDGFEEAIRYLSQAFQERSKYYKERDEAVRLKETAASERQAWAEALGLARRLIRENHAKLWRDGMKELFFEIDRCINAHGLAGRFGVKNLSSRERLSLPPI